MARRIDLSGQRFGRLTVRWAGERRSGHLRWVCRCDCGTELDVSGANLRSGQTTSCGCLHQEMVRQGLRTVHGHARSRSKSPEWRVWQAMKERCNDLNNKRFADYGGRGVCVCSRWMESFSAFYEDMGPRPSPRHQIDRIDNNGNYEPNNCRWATRTQQRDNRRDTNFVEYQGERFAVPALARKFNISSRRLLWRIRAGWPEERWNEPVKPGPRPT